MGTNWLPGMNPETLPKMRYIPKIALPTVFGDALSYMEMVNQIVYHFNEAIEGVNNLANDITNVVQNAVEGAKIPVYANLVHNGSVIISPNNWNIDKPEDIWNAIASGKMCILFGNVAFNVDGIPIVQNANKMYFVLTECYQTVVNNNQSSVRAVFMNYDNASVSYIDVLIEKNNGVVTSEIDTFTKRNFMTQADIDAIRLTIKKNVIVYKGWQRIPRDDNEYIELTDNATASNLNEYFVVQTGGSLLAPDCAPCIVVDYYNSCVGELRYGGAGTPWARIYGTGVRLDGEWRDKAASIDANIAELGEAIEQNTTNIGTNTDAIEELGNRITLLSENVDDLGGKAVKYTAQTPSEQEKTIARSNIGAAPTYNPVFTGVLTLNSGFNVAINLNVTTVNGNTVLYFDPVRAQIDGIIDPTGPQMAATKNYVDNALTALDAVKYTIQQPTENEKAIARENVGAVGERNPHFFDTVYIEGSNRTLGISVASLDDGTAILLGGTYGNKVLRNVALPIVNQDAANKEYVDNKYAESQNTVKYVQQTLSKSQAATARENIDALAEDQPYAIGPMTIFSGEELEYEPQLVLHSVGTTPNDDEYDERLNISWHPYQNDGALVVKDANGTLRPVRGARGVNANEFITIEQLTESKTPFVITINQSENGWAVVADVPPAQRLLANIITAYTNGANVLISYPTTGITGNGYASPRCVGLDYGIMVDAYNGSKWKRYQLNFDGTVTTTSLIDMHA